ncbi:MAG TPA: aldehyde reductase [Spirochaetia bacterium]|nr:aldehyde reductase [Spirochaetia bacterium]
MSGELVLVSGGSGFIGAHCILQLLKGGYRVRTTVRSLSREAEVRAMLETGGANPGDALEFVEADLTADNGWSEAAGECDYVLHVASPFPLGVPKHEDDLVIPAREGALRVLRASKEANVKRVVLTSSWAAIGYGHQPGETTLDETVWTELDGKKVSAYVKSKTLAERAAWDFIAREGGSLELSVVNPVGVLGPVLGPDVSTSIQIVSRLMSGEVPAMPRLTLGLVDVRDVADLHLRAMTQPGAKGERFIATAGDFVTSSEVIRVLKTRLGDAASRVPTRIMPDWIIRFVALFDQSIATVLPELGKVKNGTSAKAQRMLGWSPRSAEEAIVATAESLLKLGLISPSKNGR